MAFTTLAAVQAAITYPIGFSKVASGGVGGGGNWISSWAQNGNPGPGAVAIGTPGGNVLASSPTLSGQVAGQIPFYDPTSVGVKTYLAKWTLAQGGTSSGTQGTALLCDRLWDCGNVFAGTAIDVTNTGAQTITSTQWPDRDRLGGHTGEGVLIALEVISNLGAGIAANATITYTNTNNVGSRTGTLLGLPSATNSQAGCFIFFALDVGDTGVKQVNSLSLGTSLVSGSVALVAVRHIAAIEYNAPQAVGVGDALTNNFPQLFNGSVPFIVSSVSANTAVVPCGTIYYVQG